jgi:Zn-finger nucleic acid-binding protein
MKAISCHSCGAPMRLLAGRDYFVCDHCTSFHFPEKNDDGVRVLGGTSGQACPVCETDLSLGSVADCQVLTCPKCRGILANQFSFALIVESLRAGRTEERLPRRRLSEAELARRIKCPGCDQTMDAHPYYGPGHVVVDSCGACALIWVDHGELATISKT